MKEKRKKTKQKTKTENNKEEEALVKGWELNDFAVRLI